MATEVPQRELRNNTAELLRRVEKGEWLRITVHGHPVADLVPLRSRAPFVPFDEIVEEFRALPPVDEGYYEELKAMRDEPRDPFA
jgi:prevent-host-death family protein